MSLVAFGSEPRVRTGLGTGAKALLRHSPSFFIHTLHPYSRHLGASPRPLLAEQKGPSVPPSKDFPPFLRVPLSPRFSLLPFSAKKAPFGTPLLPQEKRYWDTLFTPRESIVGTVFFSKEECCTLVFVPRPHPSPTPKIQGNYQIKFVLPPIHVD